MFIITKGGSHVLQCIKGIIIVRNSDSYKIGDLPNSRCMKLSGKNSKIEWNMKSKNTKKASKLQHLKSSDIHHAWIPKIPVAKALFGISTPFLIDPSKIEPLKTAP